MACCPCSRSHMASTVPDAVRDLDLRVFSDRQQRELSAMVARDIERRRLLAIQRENRAWANVKTRADWERFRDARLEALRVSLGQFPRVPQDLDVRVTRRLEGDGYQIEDLVFRSRPGLLVTANLYSPTEPSQSMPAILLVHSHHNPKTQGELQDMGVTWARQGCLVFVMDMLGHGERRQHPFDGPAQRPGDSHLERQDYYFRYNVGLQLQLVGESLIGWLAWDLMRGVDLLLSRAGLDSERVLIIGSVAGGGDPAAVTAALDPRIAAAAPFNFGGPQPDYAVPEDAENEFYYFGVASWETTRCLRLGGRGGFAHWVILGSIAPRHVVYAHEFGWNQACDPVWPRLQRVFRLCEAEGNLDVATGRGVLQGRPPESTHCNNVGACHRRAFYPHLQRWFGMEPPDQDFRQRRKTAELMCLTPDLLKELAPEPVHRLAERLAEQRLAAARRERQQLDAVSRRQVLCRSWAALLGDIVPLGDPELLETRTDAKNGILSERLSLEVEPGIVIPLALLRCAGELRKEPPTVVILSRSGKQQVLAQRAGELAELLAGGAVVCLPDVRGVGETCPGGWLGPLSTDTMLSCRDQVLGQTLLGSRLRDVRSVLRYLRLRPDLGGALALWGDSLAAANPRDRCEVSPHRVDNPNAQAEPTPGLLALFSALYEDDVQAVVARGTFASYRFLLQSQFLYVPHSAVVPGALTVSDVTDIAAAVAPRALRMEKIIDGLNRQLSADEVRRAFALTTAAYEAAEATGRLSLTTAGDGDSTAAWLLKQLERVR